MKQAFLIMAVLFCFVASSQYTPTGSKTRFVNGIGLGTKSDAAFGTVDSLVLYAKADSTLMFKFKGTARALAYAAQLPNDSLGVLVRLKAGTSGGIGIYANNWTQIAQLGAGGSSAASFYGFAGYNSNQVSSYTTRSFTDKNYVDSIQALNVQLAGTQTITGTKTFSAVLAATSRLNIGGATDNASYALNVTGKMLISNQIDGLTAGFTGNVQSNSSVWAGRFTTTGLVRLDAGDATKSGFVAWVMPDGTTRRGYMGNSATDIDLVLENSSAFRVTGGNTKILGDMTTLNGTAASVFDAKVLFDNSTAAKYPLSLWNSNTTAGARYLLGFWYGGGLSAGSITTDGTDLTLNTGLGSLKLPALGTGTVYSNSGVLTNTNPSDSSLKDSIMPMRYGLAEILKLKPKTFYYKSDTAHTVKYGFIAQDVKPIMPDVVRKIDPKDPKSKLGLETDGIYVTLVKAIQEQQAIIDDLKKRIIALENK